MKTRNNKIKNRRNKRNTKRFTGGRKMMSGLSSLSSLRQGIGKKIGSLRNRGKTPSGEPGTTQGEPGTTQGDKTEGEPGTTQGDETEGEPGTTQGDETEGNPSDNQTSTSSEDLEIEPNTTQVVEGKLSQDIPIADRVEIADVAQGAPVNAEPMTQGNTGCPQIVDCAKKAIEVIQNCKGASEETEVSTIPEAEFTTDEEGASTKDQPPIGGKKKNKKKRRNTRKPKRRTKKRKSRRRISKKRKNRKH